MRHFLKEFALLEEPEKTMYFLAIIREEDITEEEEDKFDIDSPYLVIAKDIKEARKKTEGYASAWYTDGIIKVDYDKKNDCWIYVFDDKITTTKVSIPVLKETTLEEFVEHLKPFNVIE